MACRFGTKDSSLQPSSHEANLSNISERAAVKHGIAVRTVAAQVAMLFLARVTGMSRFLLNLPGQIAFHRMHLIPASGGLDRASLGKSFQARCKQHANA